MRKYIIILMLLFFCFGFSSPHHRIIARKYTTVSSCDTTNIIFWWRCEAADFDATNGTLDYSAGDDIATLGNEAAINTDAVKYGTNGLDIPLDYNRATFDAISAAMDDEGRVGFWLYINDFDASNDSDLFRIICNSNNKAYLHLEGTDELSFAWIDSSTTRDLCSSSSANIAANTWYFIEAAWKTSTDYREIFVNGVSVASGGNCAATIASFAGAVVTTEIGNVSGADADYYMDNVIIGSVSTDDYNTGCKDELEWPE